MFYVSSKVIDEIKLLKSSAKPKFEKELEFAMKMADKCKIIEDLSEITVDDSLIQLAKKNDMVIGTTDSELRKKARNEGLKVIYLRQKRYLVLDA
jgi:rRNA-processing protein FCF1